MHKLFSNKKQTFQQSVVPAVLLVLSKRQVRYEPKCIITQQLNHSCAHRSLQWAGRV